MPVVQYSFGHPSMITANMDFNSLMTWAMFFSLVSVSFVLSRLYVPIPKYFPPGPKGWPIIGNILQLSGSSRLELLFQGWIARFDDIVYTSVLNQQMIILNSLKAAEDLLEKRSSIYSDRPRFVLLAELIGWQNATPAVRYGPRLRKHRRYIQQHFNQAAVANFHSLQERETLTLVDSLAQAPELYARSLKLFAAATIFSITYGHTVTSTDDKFMILAEEAVTLSIETGSPAAALVDFFPILRYTPAWAPFAGFKRKALKAREAVKKMMDIPFEMVQREMLVGQAEPSLTSVLLETYCDPEKSTFDSESVDDIKGAAGTLYAAAEDTTVAVMETFLLAMTRYPNVYRKAQAEMDKTIGSERLPTLADMGSLPYLECILKEVLRWNTPFPLGLPHRVMIDDQYRGYHIPQGSTIVANIFAMLHDCDQANEFIPERYEERTDLPDPRDVVFGFGRRICPGRYFAKSSLWCMMANIIATLDIERSPEDVEKKIFPELQIIPGFISHPKPFSCSIRFRSDTAASLIRDAKAFALS